jgi:hypothetical protein
MRQFQTNAVKRKIREEKIARGRTKKSAPNFKSQHFPLLLSSPLSSPSRYVLPLTTRPIRALFYTVPLSLQDLAEINRVMEGSSGSYYDQRPSAPPKSPARHYAAESISMGNLAHTSDGRQASFETRMAMQRELDAARAQVGARTREGKGGRRRKGMKFAKIWGAASNTHTLLSSP